MKNKKYPYFLVLILLLATVLRFYRLGKYSLWFDETLMFIIPNDLKNILTLWRSTNYSLIMPFYDISLNSICLRYCSWLGKNEFILRVHSALFGIISVWAVYYFTKISFSKKAGLIASFLMAISVFHIYYSQEVRVYSFLVLLTLLSIMFFKKFLEYGLARYLISYTILNTISCFFHFSALFIMFASNFFFSLHYKKYKHLLLKWLLAQCIIILLISLPRPPSSLFLRMAFLLNSVKIWWWVVPVTWKSILITFKNFSIGYNAPPAIYLLACCLYFPLFAWGVYVAKNKRNGLVLLCSYLFIPILSIFILSLFKPFYVDRYLIASLPFFYITIAVGLARLSQRWLLLTLIYFSILSFSSLKNYYNNYLPNSFIHHVGVQIKTDTRSASKFIAENFKRGDLVCHGDENTIPQFCYYLGYRYKGSYPLRDGITEIVNERLVLRSKEQNRGISFHRFFLYRIDKGGFYFEPVDIKLSNYKRIWLVSCLSEGKDSKILSYLNAHYKRELIQKFYGLNVYLYNLQNIKDT